MQLLPNVPLNDIILHEEVVKLLRPPEHLHHVMLREHVIARLARISAHLRCDALRLDVIIHVREELQIDVLRKSKKPPLTQRAQKPARKDPPIKRSGNWPERYAVEGEDK